MSPAKPQVMTPHAMKRAKTRFKFGPGAGVLLAIVLGAFPAAMMGLDLAWIVVAIGSVVLSLAPWLAFRQVRAISYIELPSACTVHAGKTLQISVRLHLTRSARMLLVALVRPSESKASQNRAPRLLIAAMGRGEDPNGASPHGASRGGLSLQMPLRVALRGRSTTLELVARSSYPFGLVAATRSLPIPMRLTALPRLMPDRELGLQHAMAQLMGASDRATPRPVSRGEGPPSGLRDARMGDARRHLHIRASLRRGRWTAMERPELGNGLAEVTLHVPPTDGPPSRRSLAAFEAATSMTASVVQGLHRLGMDVDLGTLTEAQAVGERSQRCSQRCSLARSKTTLPHLLSLTDVSLVPELTSSATPGPRPALRPAPQPRSSAALAVELIPITSPLDLHAASVRQPKVGHSMPRLTLCIDANGRITQRGANR